ncbi:MAG: DUF1674 domain-containing protein [Geminicoccaceae bacterium]|nr:DUF1674 domain-containing protein [Geminicoccaceae bacterium]
MTPETAGKAGTADASADRGDGTLRRSPLHDGAIAGGDKPGTAPAKVIQPDGENGGPDGPEPTRFGDWEKGGRCFDF